MIAREKNFFLYIMIRPFIVIDSSKSQSGTIYHIVVNFQLELFSKRHFYMFLTLLSSEKIKILH